MNIYYKVATSIVFIFSMTQAHASEIAYDMKGSTSLNLLDHTNAYEDAFASSGDGSQK